MDKLRNFKTTRMRYRKTFRNMVNSELILTDPVGLTISIFFVDNIEFHNLTSTITYLRVYIT